MANLIFSSIVIFGLIIYFINWGLNNAYPQ